MFLFLFFFSFHLLGRYTSLLHEIFYISYQIWYRVFFWVLTYSGYAGDLSPELTLETLTGKEDAVLIDIRPEARDNSF